MAHRKAGNNRNGIKHQHVCVCERHLLYSIYMHIFLRSVLSLQSIVDFKWSDNWEYTNFTKNLHSSHIMIPQWCVLKTDEHHLHGRPPDAWSSPRHPMLEIHSSSQWLGEGLCQKQIVDDGGYSSNSFPHVYIVYVCILSKTGRWW